MKNQNKQPEVVSLGSRTRYAEATTNKDNKKPVNQWLPRKKIKRTKQVIGSNNSKTGIY